jgi:hypothetical protein
MVISKLKKPDFLLDEKQIEQYFCCCVPGRRGEEHLDFCTTHEENNVIDGYAWNLYLIDIDYEEYKRSSNTEKLRKELKTQIIELLKTK